MDSEEGFRGHCGDQNAVHISQTITQRGNNLMKKHQRLPLIDGFAIEIVDAASTWEVNGEYVAQA
eukprot:7102314-Prorocentrum_lima.AAC.1